MAKVQVFNQAQSPLQRLIVLAGKKNIPADYVHSLLQSLGAGAAVMVLLFLWMAFRAEDTAQHLQDAVPFKTVSIESAKPSLPQGDQNDPTTPDADELNGVKEGLSLPPAPFEGLTENRNGAALPKARLTDDLTPFNAYKRPFQPIAGRPMVSIVVLDYGLSAEMSKSILKNLPPDITLALNPYAQKPAQWAASARAYGHEFWLSLPMQTANFGREDTGTLTLLTNAVQKENEDRLFTLLGTATGYAGVLTQPGHVFDPSQSDKASPILKQIFGRGLAMAESNTDQAGFGLSMALESGYPYVQNNIWLDRDLSAEGVDRALQSMELMASRNNHVVAFVHPYPMVLQKIHNWMDTAKDKGIQLAPLSAMVE